MNGTAKLSPTMNIDAFVYCNKDNGKYAWIKALANNIEKYETWKVRRRPFIRNLQNKKMIRHP